MVSKSYSLVVINIIVIIITNLCALWIPWVGIKLEGAETKLDLSIWNYAFYEEDKLQRSGHISCFDSDLDLGENDCQIFSFLQVLSVITFLQSAMYFAYLVYYHNNKGVWDLLSNSGVIFIAINTLETVYCIRQMRDYWNVEMDPTVNEELDGEFEYKLGWYLGISTGIFCFVLTFVSSFKSD